MSLPSSVKAAYYHEANEPLRIEEVNTALQYLHEKVEVLIRVAVALQQRAGSS